MTVFLLNACQTHLPIVSDVQMTDSEKVACQQNIEHLELADIDYLLYANKMIDSMIKSKGVQTKTENSRMRLSFSPVAHSDDAMDMTFLNTSIKNRVIRSGLFILVDDMKTGDFHLSGAFKEIDQSDSCNKKFQKFEEFSLRLKDNRTDKILWSDKKRFN